MALSARPFGMRKLRGACAMATQHPGAVLSGTTRPVRQLRGPILGEIFARRDDVRGYGGSGGAVARSGRLGDDGVARGLRRVVRLRSAVLEAGLSAGRVLVVAYRTVAQLRA
jgi:hypothetical protein